MDSQRFTLWPGPLLAALVFCAQPALAQDTPEIIGSLSNFDITNVDENARYNDFELYLSGRIEPDCIQGWYPGWGAPPKLEPGTPFGPGVSVRWSEPRDPIRFSRTEHFGLRLNCQGRFSVRGFWSVDGRPVLEVPLPWQFWQARPGTIWDVIQLSPEFDGRVLVQREFATLAKPIELEDLNWERTDAIVRRLNREWKMDPDPVALSPGERTVLEIPVGPDDAAVVVRYTVQWKDRIVARFVNEAIVAGPIAPLCPPSRPDPVLAVTGTEEYETSHGAFTRYRLSVSNRAVYPDALFMAAPDLPPCGLNANASRTWVDINDDSGARIYGFCALGQADDLDDIWFARRRGTPPPTCASITLNDRRCNQSFSSNCASTAGLGPDCIEFEDPALGTTYNVGDAFVSAGATIRLRNFQWSNGTWTNGGTARISNAGQAGGSGQEVWVDNVTLDFSLPVQANVVFLNFGEYGGNINIDINGDFHNVGNFAQLPAVIGGVDVSITNGLGNDQGTLTLSGDINTFSLGGQELMIDHVCVTEHPGVDATGVWVLPYRVGGTRLDLIQADGLLDYGSINDAPFGATLGFQLRRASVIPTAAFYYYRFQWRSGTTGSFTDFTAPVSVSYIREDPVLPPAFPNLPLGPTYIGGKNLYRFRPHESELPTLVPLGPGQTAKWATGGNVYRGFLNTVAAALPPGPQQIKLEVYDQGGNLVTPGPATFRFALPTGQLADGTVTSAFVTPAMLDGDGVVFTLHVDNRSTHAVIDEPEIAGVGAGDCGFLRFTPPPSSPPPVDIAFHATHPDNRAYFGFRIVRGPHTVTGTHVTGQEVTAGAAGPYGGDGNGNFNASFSVAALLEGCPEAAFAEVLNVYGKATNGWHRLQAYDSHAVRAFALTPK